MGILLKGFVLGLTLVLVGCSSTGDKGDSGSALVRIDETGPLVGTIDDPAVRAVMQTGKVPFSADKIAAYLKKRRFNFPFDSSKLSQADYAALDVHAVHFSDGLGKNDMLVIEGHTDERGTRTYNLALGERRANTIRDYLVLKGIPSSRIEVVSFGFEKPLDRNHNTAAWSKNRRAEILKAQ